MVRRAPSKSMALLACMLLCQTASPQSPERCSIQGGDQVRSSLATLSAQVPQASYRRGTPIAATMTLRAGPDGVYLPRYFQDFNGTCEHGFAASLLTFKGTGADMQPSACMAAISRSGMATAESEFHNYIKLMPGETRVWQTLLPTGRISAGHYCLYAEYLSFGYMIDEVGRLPRVRSLMAKGRITATPTEITLR
jgi:hypothetical protein